MNVRILWLLALLALLAGCGDSTSTQGGAGKAAGRDETHVYTGVAEEPDSLNPFTTVSAVARRYVLGFTHEALLDRDPATGLLRLCLAAQWDPAADGLSVLVTLRDGVQWSDGSPLSLDDALFSHEIASAAGVVLGSAADGLRQCAAAERIDGQPRQFRIRLEQAQYGVQQSVGEGWIVVQRAAFLRRLEEQAAREGAPMPAMSDPAFGALLARVTDSPGPGTGPYRFVAEGQGAVSWRRGVDLTVFRNDLHWRRRQDPELWAFAGVRLRFVPDEAGRYAALTRRELDWYSAPELDRLLQSDPRIAASYRRLVFDTPTLGAYVVQWNAARAPLRDPRVRRALGMLFDREGIAQRLFAGTARPAAVFAKKDSDGCPPDARPLAFDPAAARALLADAGRAEAAVGPLACSLLVPAEAPWFRRIGELWLDAARQAGVEGKLVVLPFKELLQRRSAGDFDGCLVLLSMPAEGDPYEIFHSKGARNAGGFADAECDRLLEAQRQELDPPRRAQLLQALHRRLADLQPCALLVHPLAEVLVDRRLQGAEPGPLGLWAGRMWREAGR